METDHKSHTDRHIGISRKVQINLQRIEKQTDPDACGRNRCQIFWNKRQQSICYRSTSVGEDCFFCQSGSKSFDSPAHFIKRYSSILDFFSHQLIPDDRTGNTLMKEWCVQQKVGKLFLRFNFLAVYVNHVREKLKRVEWNTNGEYDLRYFFWQMKKGIGNSCKKIQILKEAQKPQHDYTITDQENFTPFGILILINQKSEYPWGEDHAYKKQKIFWSTPGVENQGENKHDHVFLLDSTCKIIRNKIQRKKEKYKKQAWKNHIAPLYDNIINYNVVDCQVKDKNHFLRCTHQKKLMTDFYKMQQKSHFYSI